MKLYIATLPNGYFGDSDRSWKSLNLEKVSLLLNINSDVVNVRDLLNIGLSKEDIILYTSSDEDNIRFYIKDLMYFVNKRARIIPSYEMLLAFENKGFQELYRRENNIGNISGNYFYDLDDAFLPFPKVLKTIDGAGSSGVFLVKNDNDLAKIRKKFFKVSIKRDVIKAQRKIKLSQQQYDIYSYRHKGFSNFIEQEFIPNLKHDFKVLIFGDRFYVLKRSIRKNDFRASGSGKFEFISPPKEVLDYAKEVASILDTPYLSLDIAHSSLGCHLIEYQGTNFGPYTLLNSPYRYIPSNSGWNVEKNCKDLEANFAYAINYYLDKL